MSVSELRDKCRTCCYLSLNEDNWSSGYCWQCDKPVNFNMFYDFPKEHDPRCQDVIRDGGESVWAPRRILKPYFDELTAEVEAQRKRANDAERGVLDKAWYVSSDRYEDDIAELKADVKKWADAANEQRLVAMEQADKVQELTAERDRLRHQADELVCKIGEITDAASELLRKQPYTFDPSDVVGSLKTVGMYIDELTAERDRLRRFVDGGAYDCMTCEAKAELAERADSLEAELARKQHVCDVQRESFLKLERENRELQDVCGELERTVENMRGD